MQMTITPNLIEEFLDYFRNKERVFSTIYHHKHNIEQFIERIENKV
jgi:hypothetical protein